MAVYRSSYFGRPDPGQRWPSLLASLAVTAATFASALIAMRTLPDLSMSIRSTPEAPVVVRLPVPTRVQPVPRADVPARNRTTTVAPAVSPPTATPVAPPIATPIATPIGIPSPTLDSTRGARSAGTSGAAGAASAHAQRTGLGAPMAPAGINLADRAKNTPEVRDSIIAGKMADIPSLAKTHAPSGAERIELEATQRQADFLRRRGGSAGNSRDLVILQGRGKDGVGAVGGPGIVSIDFPLFSSGPSPAQRKKNEQIDADYQRRLRRLEDRMLLKRDSLRADSLRADSLRKRGGPPRG